MVHAKGEALRVEIPDEFNLAELLIAPAKAKARENRVAYYYTGDERHAPETITFDDLTRRVVKTGAAFKALGISIEDRVALILRDTPEFLEAFLGAIMVGAQPVALSTIENPETYEYMLNDCRAKLLVADEQLATVMQEISPRLSFLNHAITTGEPKGNLLGYSAVLGDAPEKLTTQRMSKDDFCYWQYSSGTTGPPKGVVHLAHDILYCDETYYKHILQIREQDVCFSTSKLFFAYGLGNTLFAPLWFGAAAVLYPGRPEPPKVFELIQKYKATVFFSVPLIYSHLLSLEDAEKKYDTSSVRICVSAGEALPANIYNNWRSRFNVDILDGIGTTELGHIFISNRIGKIRPGSSGVPVPGYEVRVVDEAGNDVLVNTMGRLLVKGDSTAAMYWRKHEQTKRSFLGEWFDTGDTYYTDEDGYFWHVGRGDDLIKSAGTWVSPVEVEGVLLSHAAVLECAVVQSYTEEGIGRPKAFIVLKTGSGPTEQLGAQLRDFAGTRLASHKVPSWIELVDELPKTATGKIQRFRLREAEKKRLFEARKEIRVEAGQG